MCSHLSSNHNLHDQNHSKPNCMRNHRLRCFLRHSQLYQNNKIRSLLRRNHSLCSYNWGRIAHLQSN
ncbi:unnamed protein product [Blepharisma stoltei]|uniref:Uncharacterized protein n=1 Tax=Blepharisma stoltei TaxID=1481888 RepID=A0AAU9JHT2_9CILI|nr:unnamed protein product [Blepharisma stoltei]